MSPARHLLTAARASYASTRWVAARAPWRLLLFATLSLCASWALLSTAPGMNDFRDAHVLAHYETAARDAILHWHQLPLWDPYYCGGMYLLGTPQARFVSPTFLFTLLFGEQRGEALTAFAMILVGLEGAFRYLRSRGASSLGAMMAAPVFAMSGIFAGSPALGWIGFFGFELLPWIALGARRALRGEITGVIVVAVATAWCVGMGGTYAAPIAALWCAYETAEVLLLRAAQRRWSSLGVGLAMAAAGALLSAGLAAARLWPIADTLASAPRIIGGTPGNKWGALGGMLFSDPAKDTDDGAFFIGMLVLPAALLGALRRRSVGLVVAGGLSVWLALGYEAHPSIFADLRELPLYSTLRYPERFLIPLALVVATLAARGVTLFETYARARGAVRRPVRRAIARALLLLLPLCLLLDLEPLVHQHIQHASERSLRPAPVPGDPARPFHQARGNRWALEYYEPMQRGSLSCWEAYPVPESPLLRGDLTEEEWLVEPDSGTLTERSWTPGAIELDVDLRQPATLAVNQNWSSGWRSSVGQVGSLRGLLGVALPAGKYPVRLTFEPRSARGGISTSLMATVSIAALVVLLRRKKRMSPRARAAVLAAAALAPLVPAIAIAALVREPRVVEEPLTMDGTPVIVDEPLPQMPRLDVRFEGGVVMQGAAISRDNPVAGSDLVLEIDWKRDAQIDKGLGIFMHIEGGSGMNGDHVLLSQVLDLEDAPPGKTLRDVMPLWVPEDSAGKTWKVWVGLWRVRHGGERVKVVEAGQATVDADRVLAVSYKAQ